MSPTVTVRSFLSPQVQMQLSLFFDVPDSMGALAPSRTEGATPDSETKVPVASAADLSADEGSSAAPALQPEPVTAFDESQTAVAVRALPTNLAQVYEALPSLALSPTRQKDMRSALNTLSRVLGLPLDRITTDLAVLGPLLVSAMPAMARIKPKRWATVRSHTQSAMRVVGFDILPSRDGEKREADDVSRAWDVLDRALPTKRLRYGLTRVRRYSIRKGVAPDQVTLDHLEGFRDALFKTSLLKNPATAYANFVNLWNVAVESVPGWPSVTIAKVPNPRRYSLDWSAFPQSFRDEVEAYLTDSGDRDVTSDNYAESVREVTVHGRRSRLRRASSALVMSGYDVSEITGLAILTDPANAKAAIRALLDRKKGAGGKDQPSDDLANIVDLLRIVAKYWLKDAARAEALAKLASNLRPKRSGMTEKNRGRLLQFDDEQNQLALLRLPAQVLKEARASNRGDKAEALRVMWAVAIEILIMAPMRVKSLIALEPGRHFVDVGRGRQTRRHIIIPKEETKTRAAFEMRLPAESCALIDAYLATYRARLCNGTTAYLFPNPRGERRSEIFASHLGKFIERETGLKMNPHLFRHLAGKLYLEEHPQGIETVRQFLMHKSLGTTERSYVEVRAEQAFRNLDDTMLARRDEATRLGKTPPARPRKPK